MNCKRIALTSLLTVGAFIIPNTYVSAHPAVGTDECWIKDELLGKLDCQAKADADWEGLSSADQTIINSTPTDNKDQLIIDYRQTQLDAVGQGTEINEGVPTLVRVEEDSPHWDCATMGNKICGSTPVPALVITAELPRTE